MLHRIDPTAPEISHRIVQIQRAAYAIEAYLIGFDRIPPLRETEDQVRQLDHMVGRQEYPRMRGAGIS